MTNRRWLWVGLTVFVAAFTFLQSGRPAPSLGQPEADALGHILAHFALFGVLAFSALSSFRPNSKRAALLIACCVLVFALSDELHQAFVPARQASLADLVVDLSGILTALLVYGALNRKPVR